MSKLSIGKRHEYVIWGRLLEAGFDVYPSIVDDKGIDGIIGHNGRYIEVQIKSGKNWNNQRGLSVSALNRNQKRVFLIYNYTIDKVRYFTAEQILKEPEWKDSITWKISQIKLPKVLLEKYESHNWEGLLKYLRGVTQ